MRVLCEAKNADPRVLSFFQNNQMMFVPVHFLEISPAQGAENDNLVVVFEVADGIELYVPVENYRSHPSSERAVLACMLFGLEIHLVVVTIDVFQTNVTSQTWMNGSMTYVPHFSLRAVKENEKMMVEKALFEVLQERLRERFQRLILA